MSNLAVAPELKSVPGNVVSFKVLKKAKENPKPKSSKARVNTGGKKKAGVSSEVYAFRTEEEIKAMIDVFDYRIESSTDEHHRHLAYRNKLLFVVGINIGLRASDLANIRYSFFFDKKSDGTLMFKESYTLQPKKQRKQKKFVTLYFNATIKKIVTDYVEKYPFDSLDDYVFASAEGDKAIISSSLWRIIKNAAKDAGINQNIGSHSLRKTWGRFCFEKAEDKGRALVMLQRAFNHSSQLITMHYLGILDDDIKDMYESIDLGFDFI